MKHLVISVSSDSSLDLLSPYADILVLDDNESEFNNAVYETVYIRSHFSHPSLMPQNFRDEIDTLVKQAQDTNPAVRFIDSMDTVDSIVAFEDKWLQYKAFSKFMSRTELYTNELGSESFKRPIYKNRLSSRGSGITWDKAKVIESSAGWIIQETLDIQEELRIYIIFGEVYPYGAVKQSMTEGNKAEGINSRALTQDEIEFSSSLVKEASHLDMVGIDIARTADGTLKLIEVNRSPGFAKFYELTRVNLAQNLYER